MNTDKTKTKQNQDLLIRVYPRLSAAKRFCFGFCHSERHEVPSRFSSNRGGIQRFLSGTSRLLVAGRYRRGGPGEHSGRHPRIPRSGETSRGRAEFEGSGNICVVACRRFRESLTFAPSRLWRSISS